MSTIILIGFALAALLAFAFVSFIIWRALYRVPGPDEALVITGKGASMTKEFKAKLEADRQAEAKEQGIDTAVIDTEPDPEFKIVVGTGVVLRPGQRMERMSLAAGEAEVTVQDVPTSQGIPLSVTAVVIYKVGDRYQYIARAARRFSGNQGWSKMVSNVLEGHLRAVVGTMTVIEIWKNREKLAAEVRSASGEDLKRLGLQIDSFQIKHIEDPEEYIKDIAAKERAEAAKNARIAKAEAEQIAAQREAETAALTAEAKAQSEIKQAEQRAQAERAAAEADQARPLAEAAAKQAVIEAETRNAELQAKKVEQELQATVYRQADAEKYAAVKAAEGAQETAVLKAEADARAQERAAEAQAKATERAAQADATAAEARANAVKAAGEAEAAASFARGKAEADIVKARGEAAAASAEAQGLAEAKAVEARGLAEAKGLQARGDALAANKDAIIQQDFVKQIPAIVGEAASAYDNVGNMTVLNGAEGLNQGVLSAIALGASAIPAVKGMLGAVTGSFEDDGDGGGNGARPPRTPRGDGGGESKSEPSTGPAASARPAGGAAVAGSAPRQSSASSAFDQAQASIAGAASRRSSAAEQRLRESAEQARSHASDLAGDAREFAGKAEEALGDADRAVDRADDFVDEIDGVFDRGMDAFDRGLDTFEQGEARVREAGERIDAVRDRVRRRPRSRA
jgi:uncharacterized membrane protein YqiK